MLNKNEQTTMIEQTSLLGSQSEQKSDTKSQDDFFLLPMKNAHVEYYPNWLSHKHAKHLMDYFVAQLQWQQPSISLYGQDRLIPRLQAWYGDPNSRYEYSKLLMEPLPWDSRLAKLKQACEQKCNTTFNSALANFYRHGNDSMGMHADNEPELGEAPIIASVSLGQTRRFTFKNIKTKETYKIGVEHGSLLVMKGDTQQYWHHGINKSRTQTGPRLNFTFRKVTPKNNV
jgi:alkylated DNA repair dioxygenase AlkB